MRRMLQALLVGGAAGSAVASEFVIPLLLVAAGGALLALLLLRVGLEVATALLYAVGGLALGLSVTGLGRRLLSAWLIAAAAVVALPVLWSIVFATGAALMLDAGDAGGHGGFAAFVTQLYNVAAALGVFAIAIKLAQGVFRHAGGAIAAVAIAPTGTSGAAGRAGAGERLRGLAQNATPAGLARFSQQLRGGMRRAAAAGASVAMAPGRHAFAVAGAAGHPIRSTQQAAARLRDVLSSGGNATAAAARGRAAATGAAAPRGRDAQQAEGTTATPRSRRRVSAASDSDRRCPAGAENSKATGAELGTADASACDAARRAQRHAACGRHPSGALGDGADRPDARVVVAADAQQAQRRTQREERPMSDDANELRPAYRTLNEPTRLLGLSLGGWAAVIVAGGLGYGWLMLSPLGWRANISFAVIAFGAPAALLLLRESSTVSPGQLLVAVLRWRVHSPTIVDEPTRRGAVRLDTPAPPFAADVVEPDLPWIHESNGADQ